MSAPSFGRAPVLECRDLSVTFRTRAGRIPALTDFDLALMSGEAHGLVGESGCGKTTVALAIMNHLGGNGAITGGEILFEGRDLRTMRPAALRRVRGSEIAMVYQEPMACLNPSMRIGDQLAEVPLFHEAGVRKKEAHEKAERMLAKVRLPDPTRVMRAYPHQLSGGQQQRAVIAMALLANPKLLLLDEPTTALDVTVAAGIVDLIGEIAEEFGTSMIFISHNLGLIRETCSRVTVMYAGEAVETGAVDTLFGTMRHPYTRGLFAAIPRPGADKNARPLVPIRGRLPTPHDRPPGCNFQPRCAYAEAGRCDRRPIPMEAAGAGDGHAVRCLRHAEIDWTRLPTGPERDAAVAPGPVILEVDDLQKHYRIASGGLLARSPQRTIRANDGVSFDAREAETVAIVGESGCGKTTFAKVLMGLEKATGGRLTLDGIDLGQVTVRRRDAGTIARLQMIFQNPSDTLNPSHTVGRQIARAVRKFGGERDPAHIEAHVNRLLETVRLPRDVAGRLPRQLSGGQKQRVGIARAFAGNPKVVVADEPVSALDVSVQAAITRLLTDIQRARRTTLLFISHDLSIVRYLADRIVVMYLGRVMEKGATAEIFAPPYHPYTEALLSAVPIADPSVRKRKAALAGDVPSAAESPAGCVFSARCPYAMPGICDATPPPERTFGDGHAIACHLAPNQLAAMEPVFTPGDGKAA